MVATIALQGSAVHGESYVGNPKRGLSATFSTPNEFEPALSRPARSIRSKDFLVMVTTGPKI